MNKFLMRNSPAALDNSAEQRNLVEVRLVERAPQIHF
jgi:hypothetical protein